MLESDFWNRKEPIYLKPGQTCEYVEICPFKQPNCYGANSERDWDFVCDIQKLKEIKQSS